MKTFGSICLALGAAALMLSAPLAMADMVTLTDNNSEVWIDTASEGGTFAWIVDGQSQLFQQQWYYRIGDEDAAYAVSSLATAGPTLTGSNTYNQIYTLAGKFTFELQQTLWGGNTGTGVADILEGVRINSLMNGLDLHIFQYSDFDLDDDGTDDTVKLANANTWAQTSGTGLTYSETVATPSPDAYEAALFGSTLSNITAGGDLNNTAGPLTGDVTWAWQWDVSLGNGGSFIISKDKHLAPAVPAPGAALLVILGLSAVGAIKRRLS